MKDDWIAEVDSDDESGNEEDSDGKDSNGEDDNGSESDSNSSESDIDYTETLTNWLRNATVGSVEPSVRDWIDLAVSDAKPGKHILQRVLRRLSERWCVYRRVEGA